MDRTTCPLCLKPLSPLPLGEKNGYRFIACKACGSVVTDPEVTHAVRDVFYGEAQPEPEHPQNLKGVINMCQRRIGKLVQSPRDNTFLDVNCMHGYGVKAAADLGFKDVRGIDTRDFFVRFAGDNFGTSLFEQASITDYAARGGQADVILCIEGFSTALDIEAYTAALAKILAPKGVMYIEDGDGNSLWLPKTFARWDFAEPPVNSIYPSYKGIKALLARHGLYVRRKHFSLWHPIYRLTVGKPA